MQRERERVGESMRRGGDRLTLIFPCLIYHSAKEIRESFSFFFKRKNDFYKARVEAARNVVCMSIASCACEEVPHPTLCTNQNAFPLFSNKKKKKIAHTSQLFFSQLTRWEKTPPKKTKKTKTLSSVRHHFFALSFHPLLRSSAPSAPHRASARSSLARRINFLTCFLF